MTERPRIPRLTLRERFCLWRLRLQWRIDRLRRGLLYSFERLSADDAQRIFLDVQSPAGWHPLLTLTLDDALQDARETFEDHPDLARLVNQACAQVAYKWESYGDELYEARRWAMKLVNDYARDESIVLRLREGEHEDDTPLELF